MRPAPVADPYLMPETGPELCSTLANIAKPSSCAGSPRCRAHAVALKVLVPAAEQDLPQRSPLASQRHHALPDRDAALRELRSLDPGDVARC